MIICHNKKCTRKGKAHAGLAQDCSTYLLEPQHACKQFAVCLTDALISQSRLALKDCPVWAVVVMHGGMCIPVLQGRLFEACHVQLLAPIERWIEQRIWVLRCALHQACWWPAGLLLLSCMVHSPFY